MSIIKRIRAAFDPSVTIEDVMGEDAFTPFKDRIETNLEAGGVETPRARRRREEAETIRIEERTEMVGTVMGAFGVQLDTLNELAEGDEMNTAQSAVLADRAPAIQALLMSDDPVAAELGYKMYEEATEDAAELIEDQETRLEAMLDADQKRLDAMTADELTRVGVAEDLRRTRTDSYISERTSRLDPINDQLQMLGQVEGLLEVDSPAAVDVIRLSLAAYLNQGRPSDKDAEAFGQLGGLMDRSWQKLAGMLGEGPQQAAREELSAMLSAMKKPMYVRAQSVVTELDSRSATEPLFDNARWNAGFDRDSYRGGSTTLEDPDRDIAREVAEAESGFSDAANASAVGAGVGAPVGAAVGVHNAVTGAEYAAKVAEMSREEFADALTDADLMPEDGRVPHQNSRAWTRLRNRLIDQGGIAAGRNATRGGLALAALRTLGEGGKGALKGGVIGAFIGLVAGAARDRIGDAIRADVDANRTAGDEIQPGESLAEWTERTRQRMQERETRFGFPVGGPTN